MHPNKQVYSLLKWSAMSLPPIFVFSKKLSDAWPLPKYSSDNYIKKVTSPCRLTFYPQNNCMNPSVDFYFKNEKNWQEEIIKLREIVLECNLVEVLKWGCPCYTYQDKNIV